MSSERSLPEAAVEIVSSIAQHRTLTTAQLGTMHMPGRSRRWTQRVLKRVEGAGLIRWVRLPSSPGRIRLWHVTDAGAQLAMDAGSVLESPKVLTTEQAAGPLHAHTLAVSDAAITFLVAARERGGEFGPFSWRHEVSHPLPGRCRAHRRSLVADAVLTYVRAEGDNLSVAIRFLELDRATLTVDRLAGELARYAELYGAQDRSGEPSWRSLYPVFPPVLCILAGAPRKVLERRRAAVTALCRTTVDGLAPAMSPSRSLCLRTCRPGVRSPPSSPTCGHQKGQ